MVLGRVLVCERGPMVGYIIRALNRMGIECVAVVQGDEEGRAGVEEAAFRVAVPENDAPLRDQMLALAMDGGCDGVHPGTGVLAEDAEFATRVEELNMVFIGPRPVLVGSTADRWTTREIAVGAGVPVVAGSPPLQDASEVAHWFEELGGPVWVKDYRGWRAARLDTAEAAAKLVEVRLETVGRRVWLEQHIENARHLVVSVIGDNEGQLLTLGERERIVRQGDAMTLDLAPAPVSHDLRIAAGTAAITLSSALSFVGVASVGFLADPAGGMRCLGLRPRLQVGDLLSDTLHGLNSVEMQVRLALGEPLGWSAEDLQATGTALSIRIRAREPGIITHWGIPDGVIMESHCTVGLPAEGLLGVLVVEGQTRQATLIKATAALRGIEIKGVETDIPRHLEVLADLDLWEGQPVRQP